MHAPDASRRLPVFDGRHVRGMGGQRAAPPKREIGECAVRAASRALALCGTSPRSGKCVTNQATPLLARLPKRVPPSTRISPSFR